MTISIYVYSALFIIVLVPILYGAGIIEESSTEDEVFGLGVILGIFWPIFAVVCVVYMLFRVLMWVGEQLRGLWGKYS